ncbi:hypothetical protein LTR36_006677 [Oleoguttula mirabilis]|uniref:Glucosidase 2 subunit beta n=1 Tax=Oleoguttula mirabilis TaxID=1507867 RepID=A0AAV9JCB1_9PEZI|nr:hypothetical protein LTR36_006677 [Oleoguttula mirabilis]
MKPRVAKFYKDATAFTCISNPATALPIARLNDDYCDCPDGSDEPGTSACAHLSPLSPHNPANGAGAAGSNTTLALPGFYCKNKGHVPAYVPFTSVNDGKCDYDVCCDGSEEWEGVGGVKCEDRCQTIGKEWRKQDEARQKSLGTAGKKRKELVAEAGRLRKQVEDRIQSLGTEIEGSEIKVKQLEQEVADVERKEKGRVVKGSVSKKAGKLGVVVGLAKQRTEELRETLERVRGERDSSTSRLQEVERILSTFKEEYNPNFNDEGVKRAVRAWEDYAARDKGPDVDAAHDRDLDAMTKSDKENGLDWEEYEGDDDDSEADVLYAFESYLPPSIRGWLDQKLRNLRSTLIDSGILADTSAPSSSGDSKSVTDAKDRLTAAEKEVEKHRKTLTEHQDDLAKDFGPDDVFRALKDQCVSTDAGEYTYEVCFLSKTTQKPKKGGGHTNMGNFVGLERIVVDDELPPNGKGLGSGERIAMKHENGQHCWNGPNRSTLVVLACSEVNEVWRIVEEEKCVYRMEVGTPAVCEVLGGGGGRAGMEGKKAGGVRDEL